MKTRCFLAWLGFNLVLFVVATALLSFTSCLSFGSEPDAKTKMTIGFGLTQKVKEPTTIQQEKKSKPSDEREDCPCLSGEPCRCGKSCQCESQRYEKLRLKAIEQQRPLLVWVGDVVVPEGLGGEPLHVRRKSFCGDTRPRLIVAVFAKGDLYVTANIVGHFPSLENIREALRPRDDPASIIRTSVYPSFPGGATGSLGNRGGPGAGVRMIPMGGFGMGAGGGLGGSRGGC